MSSVNDGSSTLPIAYFCAEFAITQDLPIYSGGLGVLAGDTFKQASDQDIPFIAIGLFYKHGYFVQRITDGRQVRAEQEIQPSKSKLKLLTTAANTPHLIHIPHQNELITAQVWVYRYKNNTLYLLDTNNEYNKSHKDITRNLYNPDPITRIRQEIVLGIGGMKLLHSLNIHPRKYHLNEGHSAFAGYELSAHYMHDQNITFEEALEQTKKSIVFTNHTVVPAGNDIFAKHQVNQELSQYTQSENLPHHDAIGLGITSEDQEQFSMTVLALNISGKANSVSKLHQQIARSVWPKHHFHTITNGVHMPTWVAPNIQESAPALNELGLHRISNDQLWQLHQSNKKSLVKMVKQITGVHLNDTIPTIVWARRFAGYKRAELIFQQGSKLKQLVREGKLQIVFAGKAHPNDELGKSTIESIHRNITLTGTSAGIAFIPNYNIEIAKILVAGADIWLNTPKRGQEASGTSGMKSGANGVLQFSVSDGWVDEVEWKDVGWILPDSHTDQAIFDLLESEILPCYWERNQHNIPEKWLSRMSRTMQITWTRFSSARMIREYQEVLYSD